ncbi:uncharacterized protein LOC131236042 [Magnolia sinica]|uniref:uncharacterized protein LOC131236042 n=1 Tax=Magnolia sinica TaxID=86752 RepID=UPI002658818B|nr:uncharacterized protein LOC131236042 [Magnolia sinica]
MASDIDCRAHGGNIIMKLNMEKAYDRMEWPFICAVLKLAFICPRSSWLGNVGKDASSPLSSMGNRMVSFLLRGVSVRGTPSHRPSLSLRWRLSSIRPLLAFIKSYENESGQKFNSSKSSFILPTKAPFIRARLIERMTGFQRASFPITYLGVPLLKGRIRYCHMLPLIQKIEHRIAKWKAKLRNQAAKMVLIKHVLASMSMHILSSVNIPIRAIHHVEKSMASFFWGSSEGSNHHHWVSWKEICYPTSEGGLGLRRMHEAMQAFRYKMLDNSSRGNLNGPSLFQRSTFGWLRPSSAQAGAATLAFGRTSTIMCNFASLIPYG